VTDDELSEKTALFNKTLMQYGRAKALRTHLGSTAYESDALNELASLLEEIQTEIDSRRSNETKEQAATLN